jgi:hypothetical protein
MNVVTCLDRGRWAIQQDGSGAAEWLTVVVGGRKQGEQPVQVAEFATIPSEGNESSSPS